MILLLAVKQPEKDDFVKYVPSVDRQRYNFKCVLYLDCGTHSNVIFERRSYASGAKPTTAPSRHDPSSYERSETSRGGIIFLKMGVDNETPKSRP